MLKENGTQQLGVRRAQRTCDERPVEPAHPLLWFLPLKHCRTSLCEIGQSW